MRPNPPDQKPDQTPDQDQTHDQDQAPIDIPAIISTLKQPLMGWQAQVHINTLCARIGTNGALWRQCVEAGGIPVFVTMLKRHKKVMYICKNATLGLAQMLGSPHPDLLTPNYPDVDSLIAADGINVLLDVLDHHFANTDICTNTCEALVYIAPLAPQQCVNAEIIPLLLDLATAKSYDTTLMKHVSNLLYTISKNCALTDTDYKAIIRQTLTVLELNPHNTVICDTAVSVLTTILTKDPSYPGFARTVNASTVLLTVQNSQAHGAIADLNSALHIIAEKDTQAHAHVLRAHSAESHSCDICEAYAGNFMGCKRCDYDECMLCFNSKQQ